MYRKFKKEEIICDMPLYSIFFVIGEGWYVGNKTKMSVKKFTSYMDALNYAESIG